LATRCPQRGGAHAPEIRSEDPQRGQAVRLDEAAGTATETRAKNVYLAETMAGASAR
jgi:hypothetical protein